MLRFDARKILLLFLLMQYILLTPVLCAGTDTENQKMSHETQVIKFSNEELSAPTDTRLSKIEATITSPDSEINSDAGLNFIFDISNRGSKELKICNPLDFLQIKVYDSERRLLALPLWTPRELEDANQGGTHFSLPFAVASVTLNGKTLTKDEIEQTSLLMSPGTTISFIININKVDDNGNQSDNLKVTPPKSGDYTLQVRDAIVDATLTSSRKSIISDAFKIKLINHKEDFLPVSSGTDLTIIDSDQNMHLDVYGAQYNFGLSDLAVTRPLEHTFVLKNNNPNSVVIEQIPTSCTCTTVSLDDIEHDTVVGKLPFRLETGQTVKLQVTLNPMKGDNGALIKYVWVYVKGRQDAALTITLRSKP